MKMKSANTSPFFVLLGKRSLNSNTVVFGGNFSRERCERQMANPFAGVLAGTGRIEEFASRAEAWEAHTVGLNIAHGRVDFP
tara:strand:- start:51 stop:296 length:246 start_codon:yes stop_codon:yes gene_type:complete